MNMHCIFVHFKRTHGEHEPKNDKKSRILAPVGVTGAVFLLEIVLLGKVRANHLPVEPKPPTPREVSSRDKAGTGRQGL